MSAVWRKSVRSGANYGCVETARLASVIGVRDSKQDPSPVLSFAPDAWKAFTERVKGGLHDVL